ncbi:MAG TPA: hypothetical protein VGR57_11615 [Ktedonobacterales bacterium]|nr:hypothetical protein [Ktedonobacterales bacterium]
MHDPLSQLIAAHQRDLLTEADRTRLLQEARRQHPGVADALLLAMAGALIGAGQRLRAGYQERHACPTLLPDGIASLN